MWISSLVLIWRNRRSLVFILPGQVLWSCYHTWFSILPMMCGRLIIPQLLCLTSMERCCISTVLLSPQKVAVVWRLLWSHLRNESLSLGDAALQAWLQYCHCHHSSPHMPSSTGGQTSFLTSYKKCIHCHECDTLGRCMGWETGCAQGCSSDCTPRNPGVGTEMQNQRAWKCSYGVASRKRKEMWWFTLDNAAVHAKTTSRTVINLFRFCNLLKYFGSFCSEAKWFNPTKRTETPQTKKTQNFLLKVL